MNYAHLFLFCFRIMQILSTVAGQPGVDNACRDDASGVPVCSQLCTDRAGQYTCTCTTGYVLADDKRTCTITGEEPRLVFVSGKEVKVYYTESEDMETLTQLPDDQVTSLGFGPGKSVLIVADQGRVVYQTNLDGKSDREDPHTLIDTGVKLITSVAVDWVTSNIYLVDSEMGKVIVCTGKGDNCSVLIRELHHPHSILVNGKSRKLLWSEWGSDAKAGSIYTADLDGSHKLLFIDGLNRPQNLVLDETIGGLFWVARSDGAYIIHCMKLGTIHEKLYEISGGLTIHSLSVLADHLYIAATNSTVVINKFTGQVENTLDIGTISEASVYHPVLYGTQSEVNPCRSSLCSDLCVPSNSNHGYTCLCPGDMELVTERICSRKLTVERLLVFGMTGVYEVPTDFIGNHGYRGHRLLNTDVNCVVYDGVEEIIFYFDATQNAIKMMKLEYPLLPSSLYEGVYQVEGMAHDASSQALYWTTTKGQVYTGKADGSFSTKIISDLHRPRGITVDPETGYMYICDWGFEPQILRCFMDGNNCSTFIHVHDGHPNMVAIATSPAMETMSQTSRRTLYWTDSKLDMIGFVDLDVDAVVWEKIQLNHTLDSHPVGLVVTDSNIYYTDWNTNRVHYIEKSDMTTVREMFLNTGSLYGMELERKILQVPYTACSENNGGCTHLCLVRPEGQRSCLCPDNGSSVSCTWKKLHPNLKNVPNKKKKPVSMETEVPILLVVLPVIGVVILLLTISVVAFCYHRNKQRKQNWMFKFVHYMKARHSEDAEGLVSDSTMSVADPNFKQYDDIDYPEDQYCLTNSGGRNVRETSMISTDSAFTEMKDFDTYSSID